MKTITRIAGLLVWLMLASCGNKPSGTITIGFLDAFEDETISAARKGFFVALKDSGYTQGLNLNVLYRNAQNDIPALGLAVDFFVSQDVAFIASNTTLSTITAVQKTDRIPVCMMVSPSPELAGLDPTPTNLFGVYETLEYIDTALSLVPQLFPKARKIGTIINQSEPQSRDALERIRKNAAAAGLEVISLPASNSSETQLVTESLLSKRIDVFFALPDNTIFASFETIFAACDRAGIPIVTSEAGLVKRGAVAAFGADLYQWGYEAGKQAVAFLRSGKQPSPAKLRVRHKMINPGKAQQLGITVDSTFVPLN